MTHHKIRTEPDGTRVYSNYTRYKPVPEEQRVYKRRKPDDPRAVRFRGDWFLPLLFRPDELRYMPLTQPDENAYEHMVKFGARHNCEVCTRPAAKKWIRKWTNAGCPRQ